MKKNTNRIVWVFGMVLCGLLPSGCGSQQPAFQKGPIELARTDSSLFLQPRTRASSHVERLDSLGVVDGRTLAFFPGSGMFGILDAADGQLRLTPSGSSNLVRAIGRFGEGPGELKKPMSVAFNDTTLLVYDQALARVNAFEIQTGQFLRGVKHRIRAFYGQFAVHPGGVALFPCSGSKGFFADMVGWEGTVTPWGRLSDEGSGSTDPMCLDLMMGGGGHLVGFDNTTGEIVLFDRGGAVTGRLRLPSEILDGVDRYIEGLRAEGRDVLGSSYVSSGAVMDGGGIFLRFTGRMEDYVGAIVDLSEGSLTPIGMGMRLSEDDRRVIFGARAAAIQGNRLVILRKDGIHEFDLQVAGRFP